MTHKNTRYQRETSSATRARVRPSSRERDRRIAPTSPPRSESVDPSIFRILLDNVRCKLYTKFQRYGTTPVVDHEHGRNVSLNPRRRHQSPEKHVHALPETGSGHRYTTKNKEASNNVCAYRRRDRASRLPYKFRQGAILASWFPWLAGPVRSPPPRRRLEAGGRPIPQGATPFRLSPEVTTKKARKSHERDSVRYPGVESIYLLSHPPTVSSCVRQGRSALCQAPTAPREVHGSHPHQFEPAFFFFYSNVFHKLLYELQRFRKGRPEALPRRKYRLNRSLQGVT